MYAGGGYDAASVLNTISRHLPPGHRLHLILQPIAAHSLSAAASALALTAGHPQHLFTAIEMVSRVLSAAAVCLLAACLPPALGRNFSPWITGRSTYFVSRLRALCGTVLEQCAGLLAQGSQGSVGALTPRPGRASPSLPPNSPASVCALPTWQRCTLGAGLRAEGRSGGAHIRGRHAPASPASPGHTHGSAARSHEPAPPPPHLHPNRAPTPGPSTRVAAATVT